MSTQTTDQAAKTNQKVVKPKTPRKRVPKKVPNDFLEQKKAEMSAKKLELDNEVRAFQKRLDKAEGDRNAAVSALMAKTTERDRIVAGLAAIDKGLAALKAS
jgi:uncharacterized protein YlxW (UPF0749 family)